MFQSILSLKVVSISHEGNQTFFSAVHFTKDNNSFQVKGIADKALNLEVGKNYLAINAVPRNYTADGHLNHLYFEAGNLYETGSLMVESNGEVVNTLLLSGRTTSPSAKSNGTRNNGKSWNLTKFDFIFEYNVYDKTIQNKDGSVGGYDTSVLKCDYWRNFSDMPAGNEYLVQGELISPESNDGKQYFNVKVNQIRYGRQSKKNLESAPQAA
jgi:hypothetical protein